VIGSDKHSSLLWYGVNYSIQYDIWSSGNPATTKEHWLQNIPTPLPLWPLGCKAQDYCLGYLPILFKDPLHGSTDLPILMTKCHFGAILYWTSLFVHQISGLWKAKLWAFYIGSYIVVMVRLVMRNTLFRNQNLSCQHVLYYNNCKMFCSRDAKNTYMIQCTSGTKNGITLPQHPFNTCKNYFTRTN
jgi:hypothetical protein